MANKENKEESQEGAAQAKENTTEAAYFELNPASNLGGYAFGDGLSVLEGERYMASVEEIEERSKEKVEAGGRKVSVIRKVSQ